MNNWAKWDAEHGSGGGMSSAERIAAQIRGSLNHTTSSGGKVTESQGRGGAVVSRAEGSRSAVSHIQKKDLKRPAPVKGEKDPADAFRTRIRMAEYNRKKDAAKAADPVDKMTPKTEIGVNPHESKAADLGAKAQELSEAADFSPSFNSFHAAAKAHLYAASAAEIAGSHSGMLHHRSRAMHYIQQAGKEAKNGPAPKPSELKKQREAALAATQRATSEATEKAHRDAAEAHGRAAHLASAMNKPIIAKTHMDAARMHSTEANKAAKALVNAKPGSSSQKIAAAIKSLNLQQKAAHPEPVVHQTSGFEKLADEADKATQHALANPTPENHKLAEAAHQTAASAAVAHESHLKGASAYHSQMRIYHQLAATKPNSVIHPEITIEHKDSNASRFPGIKGAFSAFKDTISRRRSQKMYDSVSKASAHGLTPGQRKSLMSYTGAGYLSINTHLRNTKGQTGLNSTVDNHVKNIDAIFDKQPALPDDLITYRGVKTAKDMFGNIGSKVGDEFVDHGYGSSASHSTVGEGFGGQGALLRILHPKGSKLLKPSDAGAYQDRERELLIPRGTRFHVAADRMVTMQNGQQRRMIDLIRKA